MENHSDFVVDRKYFNDNLGFATCIGHTQKHRAVVELRNDQLYCVQNPSLWKEYKGPRERYIAEWSPRKDSPIYYAAFKNKESAEKWKEAVSDAEMIINLYPVKEVV